MNVIRPVHINTTGSFSRASTKQCIGPDGLLQTVPVDVPAWKYDPLNLSAAPVVLLELAATNLLLNSVTVATQSIATTAQSYALSFYGTGSVTMSGAATGVLTGVGASSRVLMTVSATTGTVLLTVAGSVTQGQFEVGAASSYIPTTGATATRADDIITGTGLVWSSVLETAPAAYVGGTTYAKDAPASVAGLNGALDCYVSLQAANTGYAPASSPTWWAYSCTTYAAYSSGTTYALDYIVLDPASHTVYRSLIASNTGNALTNGTKWYTDNASSTNRFAAFDLVVGTAATMQKALLMLIVPGAIDSIGLENIGASSAAITMTDMGRMTQVFSKIADLTNDATITDYDAYFFDPVDTVSGLYVDGLPPYYSGVLSLAFTGPATVSLGVAVVGNTFDLGGAQYGARVGFISYTTKVTDAFGNTSAKKGKNSKRMSMTAMINNANLDKTVSVMEELDGIPTIYVGAGNLYTSLIQFGFTKEFDTEIAYPTNSLCSYQFEGLI